MFILSLAKLSIDPIVPLDRPQFKENRKTSVVLLSRTEYTAGSSQKSGHDSGAFGQSIAEVTFMDKKKAGISQPDPDRVERPIPPEIYPVIDNDLARDNVENDLPAADLSELQ